MTEDRVENPRHAGALLPERIGRYRVVSRLSAAGDRTMTSARDDSRARDVSILLVRIDATTARKSAVRQARLVAAIEHPNVAIVYEVGEEGDDVFIVTEPLAAQAAIDGAVLLDVARGASAAHKRAMSHGSLDRFSVWRAPDGDTKIVGFGAAPGEEDVHTDLRAWGALAAAMTPEAAMTAAGAAALGIAETIDTFSSMDAIVAALERASEVPSEPIPSPGNAAPDVMDVIPSTHARSTSGRALVIASLAIAVIAIVVLLAKRPPPTASIRTRDAGPPAARGHGHSIDPRAEALFIAALQSRRDAAMPMARATLDDALRIDPAFAAAHLYRAVWWYGVDDEARAHLARANDLRTNLEPRERTLLAGYEPLLRATQDTKLSLERLEEAAREHPDDPDFPFYQGVAHWMAGDFTSAIASMALAHELDPLLAEALRLEAYFRAYIGDERAADVYMRCVEVSPAATHCLRGLSMVYRYAGRGAEAVAVARRMIALDPSSALANFELAEALECTGAPDDAVSEALEHDAALSAPKLRARRAFELRAKHAILHGRFAEALRDLEAWEGEIASEGEEEIHFPPVQKRVDLLLEMGRRGEARRALDSFLMRRPAWVPQALLDNVTMPALAQAYLAGSMDHDAFAARRDAWLATFNEKRNPWLDDDAVWVFAYGLGIRSNQDATEAITVLEKKRTSRRFAPSLFKDPNSYDGILGIALVRANYPEDALAPLHHATASCGALDEPLEHEWARMAEGEALQALGRSEEACAAYAEVIARWGEGGSPSTTADRAKRHARPLCSAR